MSKKSIFLITEGILLFLLGVIYTILDNRYPFEEIITLSATLGLYIIGGIGGMIALKLGGAGIRFRILMGVIHISMIIYQLCVVVQAVCKYKGIIILF